MDKEIKNIIDIFKQLNTVPRRSKHETEISRWLIDKAASLNLDSKADNMGNVVIKVPASPGREDAPLIVLQGHMDMVCEKIAGSSHDFSKDPIEVIEDGDWMSAKDTSLGADNGIAIAYCLALAERRDIPHPPLELLFTVDEETGLNGAKNLSQDFIRGKILVNLDSEEEGVFTIGCAGGRDTNLVYEPETSAVADNSCGLSITVGGLKGGHSGSEIHLHRANAIKLLARLLSRIFSDVDARLVSINGGSAKNAIPRDAKAVIAVSRDNEKKIIELVDAMAASCRSEYSETEESLEFNVSTAPLNGAAAYTGDFARNLIALLRIVPTGAREHSAQIPGLVETSSNLAIVQDKDGKLEVATSQRSSSESALEEISGDVEIAGTLTGARVGYQNAYPAWQPDTSSAILNRCKDVYFRLFSKEPKVEVIHAGLECAVIGSIYDGMEMISVGPTIVQPHSPDERLYLPSVETTWKFLLALLESFK